ncbi:MAG: AMP-binding protein [Myxococcales bacterium]|nr:AMP-binding protein [Myxococcales bacterium]
MIPCPVAEAARRWPRGPALVWDANTTSWAELDERVAAAAVSLRTRGTAAGARIGVASWNHPDLVVHFFAAGRVGAALVPLNMRLTDAERAQLLALHQLTSSPLEGAAREGEPALASIDPALPAAALFTSGTTGAPSLVELTHANFISSADASAENLGASPAHRWLGTLPLFHVGGLAMLYRCARSGAALVLEPGFDAARANRLFDEGITHASLVPTTLERLLDARGQRPFSGVEAVLIGGGPMTPELLGRARELHLPVLQTYGLTEACSQVTTERRGEADGTTAGPPISGVQVRIVGDDGALVAPGAIGEIEVHGPTVARGLGPWLKTKDLGSLDERGRLTVVSRRTDLIVTGGENVYPAEVEALLKRHPLIRDVAVVPRPHPHFGQEPVGVVVLAAPCEDAELTGWARGRIAAFKVPKVWVRVPELPRNAGGKGDRRKLLALAMG